MKKITLISFLLFGVTNIYSQNITNTLGASGLFSIKDGSTTFLTLSQATRQVNILGSLRLENTTNSTTGVLFKGANRFLHNYSPPGATGVNTFVGVNSGNFTMSGTDNSASYNTAVGHSSLSSLITGNLNSAFGSHSLQLNTYGFHNSAFGTYSIFSNTLGSYNSAFGVLSMYQNTTGSYNSALGHSSLSDNSSGTNNSAFGSLSLVSNQTGHNNSAFGYASLYLNTVGYPNSAYGSFSLHSNTTGFENTALGYKSLYSNTTGWQNTAIGDSALHNNIGNYNTALGYGAGSTVTTGYNLTLLGIGAIPSSPTAIDQVTLGNIWVSSLRCNVQTITSLSDKRDKKNIKDLSLGLDFITKLKPRQFNWDKRDWYEEGIF